MIFLLQYYANLSERYWECLVMVLMEVFWKKHPVGICAAGHLGLENPCEINI